ncbi:RNA polymerase sigma factor, sigma-70 family protein [Burkholderia cenocepacia]|uniref:RNA polymerase sigma factor n=1 Tax=Burkholderia latens TaxID=488446 RepID=UPI0004F934FC|nr:sigma-70 family RNA polymerase sigma factor [Burkholderia latens]AIO37613.1 RNA polymerase sigma factor, sigma-70 family protein [Burkholderia cenocepacia]
MKQTEFSAMLPDMLPRLRSFALRLTANRHDADELVQRACIRALERVHQLRTDTAPVSWVFSIVHSIWLNELRRRNRRDRLLLEYSDALLETVADPRAASETAVAVRQIVDAVERLPEPQRVTLLLVSIDGLSYREAAHSLDIPIGTVMSRISRARNAIRIALGGADATRTPRGNFAGSASDG